MHAITNYADETIYALVVKTNRFDQLERNDDLQEAIVGSWTSSLTVSFTENVEIDFQIAD